MKVDSKMKLDDIGVRNFALSKLFRDNTDRINSLNFSPDGLFLISSGDDDSIIIYDCQNGTYVSTFLLFFFCPSTYLVASN